MIRILTTEYDRISAEWDAFQFGTNFKSVRVYFSDGTFCTTKKKDWNNKLECQCLRNNFKVQYIY